MRVLLTLTLVAWTTAFSPVVQKKTSTTKLALERRDVLAGLAGMVALPGMAHASSHALQNREGTHTHGSTFFFDDKIENVREEAQMPTDGKVDLNNAPVGAYMDFPGMYPHAAGMIASNGPYDSVKDIYKLEGLTSNDIKVFKKYENAFTVNPPGRMFDERINERVST